MDDAVPPVVGLPERLDRRMRLGPFPSGRDALKFVTYAAAGALVIPLAGAVAWVPVLLLAFALSVWRPEGEAIDERLAAVVRWKVRDLWGGALVTIPVRPQGGERSTIRLSSARRAAVVRLGSLPLAYLPPTELARRFELFRTVLSTVGESVLLRATPAPIHARSFLPAEPVPSGAEATARGGYRELVDLIARRRLVRQVHLAIAYSESGEGGIARLETELAALLERLSALGVRPARLKGRALEDAARRVGLSLEGGDR